MTERKDLTVQSSGEETNAIHITNTISLPKFWKRSPALWFGQIESAFALHKITKNEIKFRYIICYLDETTLSFVSDLMETPPTEKKYETVKQRIIGSFAETNESRLRKLLRDCG